MQNLLTCIIVILALCYAFYRIWRILKKGETPCEGCELKKNCRKFCHSKEK
ncbi:MAG: FeoB-associated Cys-rich membrane protein [Bacteroidales bacterium]|nr:FeoB-associated Cys-rich membrane protein [Bacteroidales bacterium]